MTTRTPAGATPSRGRQATPGRCVPPEPAWQGKGPMPIDLALLGCGHPHLPDVLGVLASEPDLRLVAAWDADPSAIPSEIGGSAGTRAETAIRPAPALVICAPTDQRPALCVQTARAGRPFLVEEPLARTAAEARGVVREVQRSRTPAMPALFLRHLPALRRLTGVLRERMLGRLTGVTATLVHAGAVDGWFDGPAAWMRDVARAGVGGFGERGLHVLDALAVLGADEPPRLAAVVLDRAAGTRSDVGGIGLGTWHGVPLSVRAGWAVRPAGFELLLTGESGTATVRDGTLELAGDAGAPERWVGAPPDAGEAVRAFAAALRARRFPRDGLLPALRAQEVLDAAVRVS